MGGLFVCQHAEVVVHRLILILGLSTLSVDVAADERTYLLVGQAAPDAPRP